MYKKFVSHEIGFISVSLTEIGVKIKLFAMLHNGDF